jgi:hypothetical protein
MSATHTPQASLARRAGRPPVRQSGSVSWPTELRVKPPAADVSVAERASGER